LIDLNSCICQIKSAILKINLMLLFLLLMAILCSCNSTYENKNPFRNHKSISILSLNSIVSSGFFRRIVPEFEKETNCKIRIESCIDNAELYERLNNEKQSKKYDLVIGLDNCFIYNLNDITIFTKSHAVSKHQINNQFMFDSTHSIIPYGYGYLVVLYNEIKIPQPPEYFGELQDARFINQLAVADPTKSAIGRAVMFWTIALFGNDGFKQFWQSIKKNISINQDTWNETLQSLESQQCGMTFGFANTPVWMNESKISPLPLKSSLMKEGSFLYIEGAAVMRKAKNKKLADEFISYLLSPKAQKYVAFDLGLLPTNESTPLPENFLQVPAPTYVLNDMLIAENPQENLGSWLDFWSSLMSRNYFR